MILIKGLRARTELSVQEGLLLLFVTFFTTFLIPCYVTKTSVLCFSATLNRMFCLELKADRDICILMILPLLKENVLEARRFSSPNRGLKLKLRASIKIVFG